MDSVSKRQTKPLDPSVGDIGNFSTPSQAGLQALALAAVVTQSQPFDELATQITDNNNRKYGSQNCNFCS